MRHRHATAATDRLTKVGMGQAKAWQHPALAWASQLGAKPGHPELRGELPPLATLSPCSSVDAAGRKGTDMAPNTAASKGPWALGLGQCSCPVCGPCAQGCGRLGPWHGRAALEAAGGTYHSTVLQGLGAVPHSEWGWGPRGLRRWSWCSTGRTPGTAPALRCPSPTVGKGLRMGGPGSAGSPTPPPGTAPPAPYMTRSRICSAAGWWLPAALSRGWRWHLEAAGNHDQPRSPQPCPWGCVSRRRALTHGHVHRHHGVAQRQRPDVQVVGAPHPAHCQQRLLHCVELDAPRRPCQWCRSWRGRPQPYSPAGVRAPGGQLGMGTPPVWDQAAARCLWGEAAARHGTEEHLGGLEGPGMPGVGWVGAEVAVGWAALCSPRSPCTPYLSSLPVPPSPSMRTLKTSLRIVSVEPRTKTEKKRVLMGSAILHWGCKEQGLREAAGRKCQQAGLGSPGAQCPAGLCGGQEPGPCGDHAP